MVPTTAHAEDPEYWGIHLMEEVESGGLPMIEECRPDEHGVVWIG